MFVRNSLINPSANQDQESSVTTTQDGSTLQVEITVPFNQQEFSKSKDPNDFLTNPGNPLYSILSPLSPLNQFSPFN